MGGREWNSHAQGSWVGDIEGAKALGSINCSGALDKGSMSRSVNLHALLDNCREKLAGKFGIWANLYCYIPSNGFISASLVIVAAAPLRARNTKLILLPVVL